MAGSRTRVGISKINLEHLVVPKRKKVLKQIYHNVNRAQEKMKDHRSQGHTTDGQTWKI